MKYLLVIIPLFFAGCVSKEGIYLRYYPDCQENYDVYGVYYKNCHPAIKFKTKKQAPCLNCN